MKKDNRALKFYHLTTREEGSTEKVQVTREQNNIHATNQSKK